MKDTSLEAFAAILESGLLSRRCKEVAGWMAAHQPVTGNDLDVAMGPSAHKRLADLEKRGCAQVVGDVVDPKTGRRCELWALIPGARPKIPEPAQKPPLGQMRLL
jgi:hypothetical protein